MLKSASLCLALSPATLKHLGASSTPKSDGVVKWDYYRGALGHASDAKRSLDCLQCSACEG